MTVPSVDGTQKTSFDQNIPIGLRIQGLRLFSTMLNCSHIYRRRLWVAVGARAPQSLRNAIYAFISYYYPFPQYFLPNITCILTSQRQCLHDMPCSNWKCKSTTAYNYMKMSFLPLCMDARLFHDGYNSKQHVIGIIENRKRRRLLRR